MPRLVTQVLSSNINTLLAAKKVATLSIGWRDGYPSQTVTLLPDSRLKFDFGGGNVVEVTDLGDVTSVTLTGGTLSFVRSLPGGSETITVPDAAGATLVVPDAAAIGRTRGCVSVPLRGWLGGQPLLNTFTLGAWT